VGVPEERQDPVPDGVRVVRVEREPFEIAFVTMRGDGAPSQRTLKIPREPLELRVRDAG